MSDFDTVYNDNTLLKSGPEYNPPSLGSGILNSYTPLTPAGQMGFWNVNTYYLQTDRRSELTGPVACRSNNLLNRY